MFSIKFVSGLAIAALAGLGAMKDVSQDAGADHALRANGVVEISIVPGYGEEYWTFDVIAGLIYVVEVDGDDSSDLDLFVSDTLGAEVGRDTRLVDECSVAFIAQRTGTFSLRVKNCGGSANLYLLAIG